MFLHEVFELLLVFVAHLDNHTRVLSEQGLDDVAILADIVQVDMHTALLVCEAHLEQSSDKTTGRDIVASHNPALLNHLLYSHEGISKVLWILNGRNIVAHLT